MSPTTRTDHTWRQQRKEENLLPCSVHAISYSQREPEYVALRACGQHRHIFGYAQTGPDRYSRAPFELPEVPGEELVQTLVGTGFVWRNVLPGSDIPAGTVSVPRGPARPDANWRSFTCAADSRHDPLYVGRVLGRFVGTIDWYRRVCRMAPTEEQCQANNGADEEDRRTRFESNVFQVLVGLNAIRREYRDKFVFSFVNHSPFRFPLQPCRPASPPSRPFTCAAAGASTTHPSIWAERSSSAAWSR